MNERLLAMALECNLLDSRDDLDHPAFAEIIVSVERFANLVAAAEREACALVCEDLPAPPDVPRDRATVWDVATLDCAAAIRARSQS
jgi:hypothetical protein